MVIMAVNVLLLKCFSVDWEIQPGVEPLPSSWEALDSVSGVKEEKTKIYRDLLGAEYISKN